MKLYFKIAAVPYAVGLIRIHELFMWLAKKNNAIEQESYPFSEPSPWVKAIWSDHCRLPRTGSSAPGKTVRSPFSPWQKEEDLRWHFFLFHVGLSVLRTRDVYPGSRIWLFFHPKSQIRIFPSRIRIKEFKYFNPRIWFLCSRKYDPDCSFRISDPDPYFFPIPDSGSRGSKRHRISDPDPQQWACYMIDPWGIFISIVL